MTIAAHNARALGRVRSDRARWELWITNTAARLHLAPDQAERWLIECYDHDEAELAQVVACGALVDGGRIWWPDDEPKREV